MHTRTTLLLTLVTLLCASMSFAAPTKLSQQGRLLDGDGTPLTGSHGLAFTLHDAEANGNEVWREERVVEFEEGYYSITLGELVPLDDLLFASSTVWMQLAVDGAVLSPRQEVVSVPYALRAAVAEAVEGGAVDADEIAIGGSIVIDSSGNWLGTPPDWNDLTGVPTDISDGDADTDTLLGLPCADGFVAKYSASLNAWDCAPDNDVLGGLSCQSGEIPVYEAVASLWVCGTDIDTDTDTQLTEAEVDAFVANNGYSTGAHTVDTDTHLSESQVENYIVNGAITLATGSSMAGSPLATQADLSVAQGTCPSDMTQLADVCIENNERSVEDWLSATDTCLQAGRRLCTATEWIIACRNPSSTINTMGPGQPEWTSTNDGMMGNIRGYAVVLEGCSPLPSYGGQFRMDPVVWSSNNPFRCCRNR